MSAGIDGGQLRFQNRTIGALDLRARSADEEHAGHVARIPFLEGAHVNHDQAAFGERRGRGLRVALCEQGDFAGATSSASSKLIHGGLRYLEYGDLRLVRDALHEREVLLRIAPHISRPMRFVLPHVPELRPAWMIRIGLLLYDHLSARTTLPGSHAVDLRNSPYGEPLVPELRKAFAYSDGWIDDARLVILNLVSAAQHGARIFPRTRLTSAAPMEQGWHAVLTADDGSSSELRARVLLNALKLYGMILADNGSPWYVTGAPDPRWNDDDMHQLQTLHGKDFEVVNTSSLRNG